MYELALQFLPSFRDWTDSKISSPFSTHRFLSFALSFLEQAHPFPSKNSYEHYQVYQSFSSTIAHTSQPRKDFDRYSFASTPAIIHIFAAAEL